MCGESSCGPFGMNPDLRPTMLGVTVADVASQPGATPSSMGSLLFRIALSQQSLDADQETISSSN